MGNNDVKNKRYVVRLVAMLVALAIPFWLSLSSSAEQTDGSEIAIGFTQGVRGNYMAANYAYAQNDYDLASGYIEEALHAQPDHPIIIHNAYKVYLFAGRIDEAVQLAERYTEKIPYSISANLLLATHAIKYRHYDESLEVLNATSDNKLHSPISGVDAMVLPLLAVWSHVGLQDYEAAISELKAFEFASNMSSRFLEFQKGLIYDMAGDVEKATTAFENSLDGDSLPYHFVATIGNFYARQKKFDKALELYQIYRQNHTRYKYFSKEIENINSGIVPSKIIHSTHQGVIEIFNESVRVLFKNKLMTEAGAYLQLSLYLEPDNVQTMLLLASYYESLSRFDDANAIYDTISSQNDFYLASRIAIAENLFQRNDANEAERRFKALSKRFPTYYEIHLTWADLLRREEKYEEAASIYSQAIDRVNVVETKHWPIYFARGIAYERIGEWEKAEKDLSFALELKPDQSDVLNYLGYSWIDRGQNIEEAKEMIEQAVYDQPENAQIIDSMGWALYKLKDYEKSVEYLEKALELLPDDPVINDHLGDAYWSLGRVIEAKFQWRRALKYDHKNELKEDIEHKLSHGLGG